MTLTFSCTLIKPSATAPTYLLPHSIYMEPQQRNNNNNNAQLYLNTERVEYPSPTVPTPLPDSDDDDMPLGMLLERVSTASLPTRHKPLEVVDRSSPMSATNVPKYFATSSASPLPSVLQQRRSERPRSSPITPCNLNRMESSSSSVQPRTAATSGSAPCICRITDPPPSYSSIQLVRLACKVSTRTSEIFVNRNQIAYVIERTGVVGIVSSNPRDVETDADCDAEVVYTIPSGTLSRRGDVESFVRKNCLGYVRLDGVKLTECDNETTSCAMVNPTIIMGVRPGPASANGKAESTIVTLNAVVVARSGAMSYMQLEVHGGLKEVVKQLDPTSSR
ncbi:hypothetical protein BJ742DRAFT_824574, partial [Cladochytrium replicatum]